MESTQLDIITCLKEQTQLLLEINNELKSLKNFFLLNSPQQSIDGNSIPRIENIEISSPTYHIHSSESQGVRNTKKQKILSFLCKEQQDQLNYITPKLESELLSSFTQNQEQAIKLLKQWFYIPIAFFFLNHTMKTRNLKNHESTIKKVKDSAQKLGISYLTKHSVKTAIERYLHEHSMNTSSIKLLQACIKNFIKYGLLESSKDFQIETEGIFSAPNPLIKFDDFFKILCFYYKYDRLLCLYLLLSFNTAERKSSIQTLKFSDFFDRQGHYFVKLKVNKTSKHYSKRIHQCIYEEVLLIRANRFRKYEGNLAKPKEVEYLFPFISHGAINKRFQNIRFLFQSVIENIEFFKPHDTRTLHLSLIYEKGNIQSAQVQAQHSSAAITLRNYLNKTISSNEISISQLQEQDLSDLFSKAFLELAIKHQDNDKQSEQLDSNINSEISENEDSEIEELKFRENIEKTERAFGLCHSLIKNSPKKSKQLKKRQQKSKEKFTKVMEQHYYNKTRSGRVIGAHKRKQL